MHAMLVTFRSDIPGPQLIEGLGTKLIELGNTPGLIMKTFVATGPNDLGGFYLFADEASAKAYQSGEFFQGFSTNPPVSDVEIRHFHVADDPSKLLGTPTVTLRAAAA